MPGFPFKISLMVDGYAAPISSGNFIDLVQRGFYNGLPIGRQGQRLPKLIADSGVVLTSGQPADLGGNVTGFVDPRTGSLRTLPVEVLPAGAPEPLYRPGRSMSRKPALPFRACGSLGMVHSLGNPDDASSEFFVLSSELPDSPAGRRRRGRSWRRCCRPCIKRSRAAPRLYSVCLSVGVRISPPS